MTDMIERVAKAINDAMLQHGDYKPDELARVAIAAMREPTKEIEAMGCPCCRVRRARAAWVASGRAH